MKTSLFFIIQLTFFAAILGCAPVSQKSYEKSGLQPLNIQQLGDELTGRTLHLESIDLSAKLTFESNQTIKSTNISGANDTGHWSLEGDDVICLKFSSWFFGDKRCYRLIKNTQKENQYIFFTLNGARSYTATASSDKISEIQTQKNLPDKTTSVTQTIRQDESPSITSEERKQRFIRLAKNCPDCNLSGLDLSGAQLIRANLAGANLRGVNLTNAELRHANLTGADLSGAILVRANLPGADLSYADLSGADLSGCNLIHANIQGAITTNTNLTGAHLESIQGTF